MNTIFSMDFQLRAVYCHHFYFQYIPVSNRLPYGNITIMLSLKYYIASLRSVVFCALWLSWLNHHII